jgi:Arm DNA-binding domain
MIYCIASHQITLKLTRFCCPGVVPRRTRPNGGESSPPLVSVSAVLWSSMSKRTLTDRFLKTLKPAPVGKRPIHFDAVVPGLGARVTDKGTITFVLVARYPGSPNPTPRQIGKYGAVTLEEARKKARLWHELLSTGEDPKQIAERERAENQRKQKNSFAHVAEDFIRREVAKKRRGADMERELRREFVARWGGRPVTDIKQHDVLAVLDEVVERDSPSQARALFGHVRRLYNWALSTPWRLIAVNSVFVTNSPSNSGTSWA